MSRRDASLGTSRVADWFRYTWRRAANTTPVSGQCVKRVFVPKFRKWALFDVLRPNLDGLRAASRGIPVAPRRANPSAIETQGDAYVARACTTRKRRGAQPRSRRVSRDARPATVGAAGTTAMGPGCRTMRGTARRSGRCQVSAQDARWGFHQGRTRHDGEGSPASARPNSRRLTRRALRLKACQPAGPLVLPKSR
jgi:hypothetical protein